MLGLLIIAGVLTMQTLPVQGILTEIMTESSEDIEALAETQEGYEHFTNHLITESAEVAVHEAAYDLDEGGVDWQSELPDSGVAELVGSGIDTLEGESQDRFEDNLQVFHCSMDHELEVGIDYLDNTNPIGDYIESISIGVEHSQFSDPLAFSCNSMTEYRSEQFERSFSTDNDWIQLLNSTAGFFDHSYDEFEGVNVQETYSAEETSCGPFELGEEAIDTVEDDYESDTPSNQDFNEGLDSPSYFGHYSSRSDDYNTLKDETGQRGTSEEDICDEECIEEVTCSEINDAQQCSGTSGCMWIDDIQQPQPNGDSGGQGVCVRDHDEPLECDEKEFTYYHESEAEIEPTETTLTLEIWSNRDIPVEGEYRELEFDIDFDYDW